MCAAAQVELARFWTGHLAARDVQCDGPMRACTFFLLAVLGCGSATESTGSTGPVDGGAAKADGPVNLPEGEAGGSLAVSDANAEVVDAASQRESSLDESGALAPLAHCIPAEPHGCVSGSKCVEGCPSSQSPQISAAGGICSVPGREACGCGVADMPCTSPGFKCLYPSCCDFEGLCVTQAERADICAGPDAPRFACH